MLTKSGAKLLDFGLARPTIQSASLATLSMSDLPNAPVTEEGTIVGTFQYMWPEQVEGKELDARSDIFSLGTVLYEMLTGQRAFQGKSQLSVASAILEKEPPPITKIKPLTPQSLDHVVRRCLTKDPDDRWQTARDLALELMAIRMGDSSVAKEQPSRVSTKRKILAWPYFGLASLLALAGLYVLLRSRSAAPSHANALRASIVAPVGKEFNRWAVAAVSPDGQYLVCSVTNPGSSWQLYIRRLSSVLRILFYVYYS
jgi:eukaryotic-like serine/threonine-protein kinase